jgi:hypothetical protein
MPTIDLWLDGDGVWPDLATLRRRGKLVELSESRPLGMTVLAGGMGSGRASVAMRFELPDGRVAFAQTSLRSLWNVVNAIAVKHGESFMQRGSFDDEKAKHALVLQSLIAQLADCQIRLGEEPTINMESADAVYDELVKLRAENESLRARLAAS